MQTLRLNFQRFLATQGYSTPPGRTACALNSAKILAQWREMVSAGRVKIEAKPEDENYFDVFGKPEGYTSAAGRHISADEERKEIEAQIERNGCWCVVAYYHDGNRWQWADSIGMCVGYSNPCDPFQNDYVIDLMASALKALENHVEEMAGAV